MGIYDGQINRAYVSISKKGTPVDIIRPLSVSYDPGDEVDVYTSGDLSAGISASEATLNLTNITNGPFPSKGILSVGSELIKYAAATGATLTSLTRGFKGTDPATHATSSTVDLTYETFSSVAVFSNWRSSEIDGDNIMIGDKKLLIPGKNSSFEIDTESLVVFGDESYQVIDAKLIAPDGASEILYIVQGR